MARFRGILRGQSGREVTRLGSANSGLEVQANGWESGVRVVAYVGDPPWAQDTFDIYATCGSSEETEFLIGTLYAVEGESNPLARLKWVPSFGNIGRITQLPPPPPPQADN